MKNKVVIITGGSSGIGKALAKAFGVRGSKVLITGRKQEALDDVVKELLEEGIDIAGFQSDVSKEADNKMMVEKAIALYGGIDVLINNAGISMRALFQDLNVDVIKRVMDVNFYGTIYATKYCLPYIMESKGSIVGISSIAGYRGLPARSGYSASKFALHGFLESLRTEMLKTGVHVLTACPGFTASNIRNKALIEDGSEHGDASDDGNNEMSAEECATHIYMATKKRKKLLRLTTLGKLTVFFNKWAPGFMDKVVYNTMTKEKKSPFKKYVKI